ncbi:MAG: thioredoxin family protein [Bacteroidetes bacterium]|nr:thioredoxin family protein [Bacteroidota bacterium]
MGRIYLSVVLIGFAASVMYGQAEFPSLYNPNADAGADIMIAVEKAGQEGKHVLLQVGGNWCPWCLRFHKFVHEDIQIDSLLKSDYVFQLVNYSKENKNTNILADLGYPQRFGFPVLIILDGKGNRLHTQNSAYLEKEKSYDKEKIIEFLKHWSPAALNPENY